MNTAIILAGGVGSRVGADIPKQFIEVVGRPVLSYTIEAFDRHPEIDSIEVVCRKGYESELQQIIDHDGFSKVRWIAEGGETFQDSVRNGINHLVGKISDEDQLLIHYGASPFVSEEVITDAISVCKQYGNASPSRNYMYLIAEREDDVGTTKYIDRDRVICLNGPQALRFDYARWIYEEGERRDLLGKVDPHTTSLMFAMGEKVYFSKDSTTNIKITTADDLKLFEGWVLANRLYEKDA